MRDRLHKKAFLSYDLQVSKRLKPFRIMDLALKTSEMGHSPDAFQHIKPRRLLTLNLGTMQF